LLKCAYYRCNAVAEMLLHCRAAVRLQNCVQHVWHWRRSACR